MKISLILVSLLTACLPVLSAARPLQLLKPLQGVKRILVLGDSITYAGGYVDQLDLYIHVNFPNQKIEIVNLGLPSENLSGLTESGHAGGAFPRPDLHERLDRALSMLKPDMVLACYGMNDGIYAPLDAGRFQKFEDGVSWLKMSVLKTGARLWLVTPPPFDPLPVKGQLAPAGRAEYPSGSTYEGYDEVLTKYSEYVMAQKGDRCGVIDIHTPLDAYLSDQRKTQPSFTFSGDGVHLNETGHQIIAREILRAWGAPEQTLPPIQPFSALPGRENDPLFQIHSLIHDRQRLLCDSWLTTVGHKRPGMNHGEPIEQAKTEASVLEAKISEAVSVLPVQFPRNPTDYHGFNRFDFDVDGVAATVVTPTKVDPNSHRPWIWRAEFFDHRPELDLALLAKGFYLVYIQVGNTFGAPSAMKHWDVFYDLLTKRYGLSTKPTLEGLSRGGLYIYNWAAKHPNDVSVLYGDNPVCDFKSWPGGKGVGPGSPDDWKELQKDYGFKTEAEALAYRGNPIDELEPLARAHVPIIHLAADADEAVPYPENTVILEQRYKALGGDITVMVKHGFHHHPHGLDDPTPLVEFILKHTQQ